MSQSKPFSLILLILLQAGCAAFFLIDVVGDFRAGGLSIELDAHLLTEFLATLTLIAAIVIEARYLARQLRREQYLQRSVSRASSALHDVIEARFESWGLTRAEHDVAALVVKGFSINEIAELRGSAVGTVKAQLNAVYRKSDTGSRAELLALFIEELMGPPLLNRGTGDAAARE